MQKEKTEKKEIKGEKKKEIVETPEKKAEKRDTENPEIKKEIVETPKIKEEKIVKDKSEEDESVVKEKSEEKIVKDKSEENESKETDGKNKETKKSEDKVEEPNTDKNRTGKRDQRRPWKRNDTVDISGWEPKTELGREVKNGKIKSIDEILDSKRKILESEIVDSLMEVKSELINIGQSKGKFGGGKRRIWRQTQRKTKEGNVPTFSTLAVIGDGNGHIGVSSGKSKETLPAREKAVRKAKLEIFKVGRGCSGFDCSCPEPHTIPFKITGKTGSLRLTLIPAAQGTGLVVASELKKVLKLAGIKDVYSRAIGKKRTTFNLVKACIDALKKTSLIYKK